MPGHFRTDSAISGTPNADVLTGTEGSDIIDGGAGNDTIEGAGGRDTLIGGSEIDTVSYAGATAGVSVNLAIGKAKGAEGTDLLSGFESVQGGAFDDTIVGSRGTNWLYGGGGNDVIFGGHRTDILYGGDGDDTLIGGRGHEYLNGGSGADTFLYTSNKELGVGDEDYIADLASDDRIDLHSVDADITQAGDQAFRLVTSFSGHAGELTIVYDGSPFRLVTIISGDWDGDGVMDFRIQMPGDHHDFANFVL